MQLGIYKHSKSGKLYRVIGTTKHSETLEDLVLYEPLYDNELSRSWVRPQSMFEKMVEIGGEMKPRFEFVEETKIPVRKKRVGAGVGVMVVRDNKILLGLRHGDLAKADSELHGNGTWTMPGGGLELGESLLECARREVMEETGITVNALTPIAVNHDRNEHASFITIGFYCDDFSGEPQVREPDEITEWQWFDIDSVPENLFMPSAHVLENYKRGEFYISRD